MNLRARPAYEAEVVGQVSTGAELLPVGSLREGSEWVEVFPPDDVDLWIFSQLLTGGAVNAGDTLVRGGPGLQYKPVGKLPKGTKVVVRGSNGNWTSVAPVPAHCSLWIHSDYVEEVEPPPAVPPEADGAPVRTLPPRAPKAVALPPGPAAPTAPAKAAPVPVKAAPPAKVRKAPAKVVSSPRIAPSMASRSAKEVPSLSKGPPFRGSTTNKVAPRPKPIARIDRLEADVAPKVAPVTDDPTPFRPSPSVVHDRKIPPPLIGVALDGHYRQGTASVLRGRLLKAKPVLGGLSARYQLEEGSTVICRLTGCSGQWAELLHSDVEVRGTLWMLADDPVPVLHAIRVDRLFSHE